MPRKLLRKSKIDFFKVPTTIYTQIRRFFSGLVTDNNTSKKLKKLIFKFLVIDLKIMFIFITFSVSNFSIRRQVLALVCQRNQIDSSIILYIEVYKNV